MGDKGRQDLGKADTPPNTGTHVGTMGRQEAAPSKSGTHVGRQWESLENNWGHVETRETRPQKGGHTIQERETRREVGDNGRRQGETRPWRTHRPTQTYVVGRPWETRGDKTSGRRKRHQADMPSQAHMWGVTMGDTKGRQDVVKADKPSNTGTRVRRQWETMGDNRFNRRQR